MVLEAGNHAITPHRQFEAEEAESEKEKIRLKQMSPFVRRGDIITHLIVE
jgi:hypothetical protein